MNTAVRVIVVFKPPLLWCGLSMHLVFMAGALAVLCEALQGLVDEGDVLLVDVQAQQAEASCGAATDAV